MTRIERIKTRLTDIFQPDYLEIIDEGHQHIGHPGAKSGLGHFCVIIKAPALTNKPLLQAHRLIYEALGNMMKNDIHALRLIIK